MLSSYIVPIPLELLATGLRLTVKLEKTNGDKMVVDDYLMVFATVRLFQNSFRSKIEKRLNFASIAAVAICVVGLVY